MREIVIDKYEWEKNGGKQADERRNISDQASGAYPVW